MTAPGYTILPKRATKVVEGLTPPPEDLIKKRLADFEYVKLRELNQEGETEVLDGVTFTHKDSALNRLTS